MMVSSRHFLIQSKQELVEFEPILLDGVILRNSWALDDEARIFNLPIWIRERGQELSSKFCSGHSDKVFLYRRWEISVYRVLKIELEKGEDYLAIDQFQLSGFQYSNIANAITFFTHYSLNIIAKVESLKIKVTSTCLTVNNLNSK
jgi:hypothetical protein